jgi:hypothetical protein
MKRFLPILALSLSLAASVAVTAAQPTPPPPSEQSLRAFLQTRFHDDRANYPDTRYVSAWTDLNGDGRPEAFVYLISGAYCGSGGCNLMIFTPDGRSWRQVADMSVTNPPIRVLDSRTRGWNDISVFVAGGGARGYPALLAFNGRSYPGNPTVAPARRLRSAARSREIIRANDPGQPLF